MSKTYFRGRPRIQVFQYASDGKFLKKWESVADVRQVYYPDSTYPIFQRFQYHILPDDSVLLRERVGRAGVITLLERIKNPLIIKEGKMKPIEVVNMDGEVVAGFANEKVLVALTNMSPQFVWAQLNVNNGGHRAKNKLKLTLRYMDLNEELSHENESQ